MTLSNSPQTAQTSFVGSATRSLLGNRFGLLAIATLVLGLGAYSSWGWLVAIGIAPLLLSIAPCIAMCALGLCTMGGKAKTPTDAASPGSGDIAEKLGSGTDLSKTETQTTNKKNGNCC